MRDFGQKAERKVAPITSISGISTYATNTIAYKENKILDTVVPRGIMLHCNTANMNPAICMHYFPTYDTEETLAKLNSALLFNGSKNSWNQEMNFITDGYHIVLGMDANGDAVALNTLPFNIRGNCVPKFQRIQKQKCVLQEVTNMRWPVPGYTSVSSGYGERICPFHGREFHDGIDIPASTGSSVVAVADGVVIQSGAAGAYGLKVTIKHNDELETFYAHNSSLLVRAGQQVKQGDVIAKVGSTGSSTGPHCHFGTHLNGSRSNPWNYINKSLQTEQEVIDEVPMSYDSDGQYIHIYVCGFNEAIWYSGVLDNFKSPLGDKTLIKQHNGLASELNEAYYSKMLNVLAATIAWLCDTYNIDPILTHTETLASERLTKGQTYLSQEIEIPNIITYESYKNIMLNNNYTTMIDQHSFEHVDKFLDLVTPFNNMPGGINFNQGNNYSLLEFCNWITELTEMPDAKVDYIIYTPTATEVFETEKESYEEGKPYANPNGICAICEAACLEDQRAFHWDDLKSKMRFVGSFGKTLTFNELANEDGESCKHIFNEQNNSIVIKKETINEIIDYICEVYAYGRDAESGYSEIASCPFKADLTVEPINRYFTEECLPATIYNKMCEALLALPLLHEELMSISLHDNDLQFYAYNIADSVNDAPNPDNPSLNTSNNTGRECIDEQHRVYWYSKKDDGELYLDSTQYFKVKDFACHDGSDAIKISLQLVDLLVNIRKYFNAPVTINSGYRTESWNSQQSGAASNSQHLYGMAADIVVQGYSPSTVYKYVSETLMPSAGGVGSYSTFTHVDVRDKYARW